MPFLFVFVLFCFTDAAVVIKLGYLTGACRTQTQIRLIHGFGREIPNVRRV